MRKGIIERISTLKSPNKKILFVFLLSTVVILSQAIVFWESGAQSPPQEWSDLYIPQHPELNLTLSYSSSLHQAGFPVVITDLGDGGAPEILFGSDEGILYIWNGSNNVYGPIWNDSVALLNPDVVGMDEIFSIAVGDIDTNTSSIEILVGTVNYITVLNWTGTSCVYDRTIELANVGELIVSSLIVEDIDDDSNNEIIAAVGRKANYADNITSHYGKIFVWKATTFRDYPGSWNHSQSASRSEVEAKWYANYVCYSLITGDPDNDNETEIIAHLEYLGVGGTVIINSSTYDQEWTSQTPEGKGYGLACGDVDDDGDNELAIGEADGTIYILSAANDSYSISESVSIQKGSLVWGLKITDSDNDTRNELIATTLLGYLRIFQWDRSLGGLEEEDTGIKWIGAQAGAFNYICVGDPDQDNWTELAVGKAGPNSGFGLSDYDLFGHLHIFGHIPTWTNVTSTPPSTIEAATPVIFNVQYNRTDLVPSEGVPGLHQVVGVNNDTHAPWEGGSPSFIDEGSGNYTIELPTTGVGPGTHTVRVILFKTSFEPGEVYVNFTVTGVPTNATVFYGAFNLSGYWETYGAFSPYVNSTDRGIGIFYRAQGTGAGIIGASGRASLYYLNGTAVPGKGQLPWYDLYESSGGNISYRGAYYAQLDTYGVHVGDYNLTMTVWKEKYNPAELWVLVHVEPIPSSLIVEGGGISVYEGGDFDISVFFMDDYHLKYVSNGAVTLTIVNGTWNWGNYVNLSYWTFGLYEIEDIQIEDVGIVPGTYTIVINGSAPDYENCQTNISLVVSPKANVILALSQLPSEIMAGELFVVEATLTYENGTAIADQEIIFTYTCNGIEYVEGDETDENGKASILIGYPAGTTRIEVSARYDGSTETNPIMSIAYTAGGTTFVRILTILEGIIAGVIGVSPFLGIGAAVAAGSVFSFHRFVRVPRRRRRLEELSRIAETFDNFENMQHIIVLEKSSGVSIYDQSFIGTDLDSSLVSGFLQAISSFGAEFTREVDGKLRELTYEGFRMLVDEGEYVKSALILSKRPTSSLRDRLSYFTGAFEQKYEKHLRNWTAKLDHFENANLLVEDVFELSLISPHKISTKKAKNVKLSDLERSMVRFSEEFSKQTEIFFLSALLSMATTMRNENKLEILDAIYKLVKKGILYPA
ncbi:MAG: hypothetical protein ACFE7E_02470 [Candidatus Hodarchaeota archaeon]